MNFRNLIILFFIIHFKGYAQQNNLFEDFSTCNVNLPNNWTQYSITGSDTWKCTASGFTNNAVLINGYSGGNNNVNEDWLVSPAIDLSHFTKPILSFLSRTKFAGNAIQVFISTNYNGNPNIATWNLLNADLPANNSDYWHLSDHINLSNYKNQIVNIAFKYTSNTDSAALWRIDNVQIYENGITFQKKFINVGQTEVGTSSDAIPFTFQTDNFNGFINIVAPSPFEISKNNINFTNQISYDSTIGLSPQTLYVRISPSIADKVFRDSIIFYCNGNQNMNALYLLGTSLPDDKTLRVVNWNMRWFGEPSWCACDTSLALSNATAILKDLNADVYCIQEMVNLNQLAILASSLGPNYAYIATPYGSGAPSPQSGFYVTCQKIAFIYNTNKIQDLGTFGLLKSTYPNDSFAYNCFASGRYPFIMKAKLNLQNNLSDTIYIANIHAKAGNTQSDYNRRECATQLLTDSLNFLFPNNKIIIIGDYNDFLEGSNVNGNIVSPYKYLLDHNFNGITLPSLFPGQSTYIGSNDFIIDNIACSPTMKNHYVSNSFIIFTEGPKYIDNFKNTTSDHYPCMSYYRFNFPNAINEIGTSILENNFILENPSRNHLEIFIKKNNNDLNHLKIYNSLGQIIYKTNFSNSLTSFELSNITFPKGIYFVEIFNNHWKQTQKWVLE